MKTCPESSLVGDYVCGQLSDEQRHELEQHLLTCPACADLLRGFAQVTGALCAAPGPANPALQDRILARIHRGRRARVLALAASLLALLGAGFFFQSTPPAPIAQIAPEPAEPEAALELAALPDLVPDETATEPAALIAATPEPEVADSAPADPSPEARASAWLIASQDASGGWSMGRTGAAANYTVGVSALAVLALMAEPSGLQDTAQNEAIRKGLEFLLSQQDAEGLFGPAITGSLYNHTLACVALAKGHRLQPDEGAAKALRGGLDLLVKNQRAEGGWSYLRARSAKPNAGLTIWALLALAEAGEAGLARHSAEMENGIRWVEGVVDAEGRAGYRRPGDHPHGAQTLTAAAALCLLGKTSSASPPLARMLQRVLQDAGDERQDLDFYRTYFQSAALREAGLDAAPELAELTARLASAQETTGADPGSWPASDPWSRSGGRVYSTALALLALNGG